MLVRILAILIGNRFLVRCGIAKLLSVFVRIVFNCQISPGVVLGKRLQLGYGGLGIVIHGSAVIGNNVSIGPHVVIGGNAGKGGVPKIGDDVTIGPGAKILGPVILGNGCVVGANSVVITDVEELTTVAGLPAKPIRRINNI